MGFNFAILVLILALSFSIVPLAYSADESAWWRKTIDVYVSTDSTSYKAGDLIRILGEVKEILSGVPITLHIINPEGILVKSIQLDVDYYKKFGTAILTDDLSWKVSGEYIVKATYGTNSKTVETSFQFVTIKPTETLIPPPGTDIIIQQGSSVRGCEETDSCFMPAKLTVFSGESITWFNGDSVAHTVTSGNPGKYAGRLFDRTLFNAGDTFTFSFEVKRDYSYHCLLHPWMKGVISVVDLKTEPDTTEIDKKPELQIPEWVKNNAKWWSDGEISESEFIKAIQYLIEHQVIAVQKITEDSKTTNEEIPEWVKNTTSWWAENQISDIEFLHAIQFLIEKGIIKVN